jgi:hypothetical protein
MPAALLGPRQVVSDRESSPLPAGRLEYDYGIAAPVFLPHDIAAHRHRAALSCFGRISTYLAMEFACIYLSVRTPLTMRAPKLSVQFGSQFHSCRHAAHSAAFRQAYGIAECSAIGLAIGLDFKLRRYPSPSVLRLRGTGRFGGSSVASSAAGTGASRSVRRGKLGARAPRPIRTCQRRRRKQARAAAR